MDTMTTTAVELPFRRAAKSQNLQLQNNILSELINHDARASFGTSRHTIVKPPSAPIVHDAHQERHRLACPLT